MSNPNIAHGAARSAAVCIATTRLPFILRLCTAFIYRHTAIGVILFTAHWPHTWVLFHRSLPSLKFQRSMNDAVEHRDKPLLPKIAGVKGNTSNSLAHTLMC